MEGIEFSTQSILDNINNIKKDDTLSDAEKSEKIKLTNEFLGKFMKLRQCEKCQNLCFTPKSCDFCMKTFLESRFDEWDSENDKINAWIQNFQKNFIKPDYIIEWIPYDSLQDITYLSEGGFYFKIKAMWPEGRYVSWDYEQQELKRFGPQSVTIKYITNNTDQDQWLREIKAHLTLSSKILPVIRSYGLTKDGNCYMVVTENVAHDLRKYLQEKISTLNWVAKYKILLDILDSLSSVHNNDLIHGDLHSGVIWYSTSREIWLIGDLRFCRPIDNPSNELFGTIQYVAPEILKNQKENMTTSSDVYSFAMIMWEVSSGNRPYDDYNGADLSEDITKNNLRPEIMQGTPQRYSKIMRECWDDNPSKRPDIKSIQDEIKSILSDYYKNNMPKTEQDEMKMIRNFKMLKRYVIEERFDESSARPNEGVSVDIIKQDQISAEKFIDEIERISFATVSSTESSTQVAIKTLRIDKGDKSANSSLTIYLSKLQEVVSKRNHQFQHTNIVEFLGVGTRDECKVFLVMPIANGGNLRDYLKANKKLSIDKKLKIVKGIASGIMKLHGEGITHENIKPFDKAFRNRDIYAYDDLFDNIGYIDPNAFIKINGNAGDYNKDKSTDIYSLGTLLWEVMSEKIPYQDEFSDGGILGLIRKIKDGHREKADIPDITKFPAEYINLYTKCWNGDSAARPTIKEVNDKLININ
ncbi:11226_t:CDS:2 [Rhizophagus irregularis]|nr:11226_t:CDS:2 [Rhizophagus irregularis]